MPSSKHFFYQREASADGPPIALYLFAWSEVKNEPKF